MPKRKRKAPLTIEDITTKTNLKGRRLINAFHEELSQTHDGIPVGLDRYQATSLRAQRNRNKGGDTSRILVQWLRELNYHKATRKTNLLDIGCLDPLTNFYARNGNEKWINALGIDLRRASPGVIQQDFMERPIPTTEGEKFDVISLSLVLNFVPTAKQRGEMLRRTTLHLRADSAIPSAIFIVLPTPCLLNSKHLTPDRFYQILKACGYKEVPTCKKYSKSGKLCYFLFTFECPPTLQTKINEETVRPMDSRNSFSIVLE